MIVTYIVMGITVMIPVIPFLYAKCLCNQFYITFNKRTDNTDSKLEIMWKLIQVILFNPAIIIMSIIVDIGSLPPALLQDSKKFEYKY
jgi:hypothetical protein